MSFNTAKAYLLQAKAAHADRNLESCLERTIRALDEAIKETEDRLEDLETRVAQLKRSR